MILSIFPGIGGLDYAFEAAGFCVVRGPDILWGGDVHRFHPPSGIFRGVIGGPPCQCHSEMARLVKKSGRDTAPDLVPEFVRVVAESQPEWFLMENVPGCPSPSVKAYEARSFTLTDWECGGKTSRNRRFWFGARMGLPVLDVRIRILREGEPDPPVLAEPSPRQRRNNGRGRYRPNVERMAQLQGFPDGHFDAIPFTSDAARQMIANCVPIAMGKAIANAIAVWERVNA